MATEMNRDVQPARIVELTNDEYHADTTRVGNSMAKVFRRSRMEFYQRYVSCEIASDDPTPSMVLGSAVDALVEGTFQERFALCPECDRRTKEGKAAWLVFQEERNGRDECTPTMYRTALRIVKALQADEAAKHLLWGDGVNQLTLHWEHWQHALPLKARFDRLFADTTIIDLKTAIDPTPAGFARQAARLGYFHQADWYTRAYRAMYSREADFVFVVVGNEPPHEVFCYEPDADDVARAFEQNERTIEAIARCHETGDWRTPGSGTVSRLSLPNYTRYNDYEMEA